MFIASENKTCKMRRVFVAIAVVAFLTASLIVYASGQEKVTIEWWSQSDPGTHDLNVKILDKWAETHPNIKVAYEEFPQIDVKIATGFAAGIPPDIAWFAGRTIGKFLQANLLLQLTPDMMSKDELHAILYHPPEDRDPCIGSDGEYYAVPTMLLASQSAYMVNDDLWKEAGVAEFPKTWEEFMAAARKLTKKDETGKIIQAGMGRAEWDVYCTILLLIKQFGGEYYNDKSKRWNFTTPKAIQAIEFWRRNYLQVNGPEIISDYVAFLKGHLAMLIVQAWAWKEITNAVPSLEGHISYRLLPPPPVKNADRVPRALLEYFTVYAAPATTKYKEAVREFLRFRITPEILILQERTYPWMAPYPNVWEYDDYKEGGVLHYQAPVLDILKNHPEKVVWDYANLPGRNEINSEVIRPAWEEIIAGELSVEEAAAEMERGANEIMKRYFP